jgi:carbon starvation protein
MVNSAILLVIALLVFAFGYRFYAKFLAAAVFRLDNNYSPPSSATGPMPVAVNRHLLFGHHLAMLAAGSTVAGAAVALVWGWVPAFLWAVVGSVIAAGTYGLGGLWLGFRQRGLSPAGFAGVSLGSGVRATVFIVSFAVLLLLTALLARLAAQLLTLYPHVVLAFWMQFVVVWALGRLGGRGENIEIAVFAGFAPLLALAGLWLFKGLPLAAGGALTVELDSAVLLTFDDVTLWLVLVLALSFASTRLPIARVARPYGVLTAVQLVLALLLIFAAVLWVQPPVIAPQFASPPESPGILPWVFITLVSGALAGFHLLIAHGISARQLKSETDARYIGYGGALGEGLVAVAVVIACAAGFGGYDEWSRAYAGWSGLQNFSQLAAFVIERWVTLARGLGLDANTARAFFALLVLNLSVTTLEAGIRLQRNLLREVGETYRSERLTRGQRPLLLAVALAAAVALYDPAAGPASANGFWPLFGIANHLLAAVGFVLMAVLLARLQRPLALVIAPLVAALAIGVWALVLQTALWRAQQRWGLIAIGLGIALAALWALTQGLLGLRQTPQNTPET